MASVPVSLAMLEEIVGDVAIKLLEYMVTVGDYTQEELPEVALYAADITAVVIDEFMSQLNAKMEELDPNKR